MSDVSEYYLRVDIPKSDGFHSVDDKHMAKIIADAVIDGLRIKQYDRLPIQVTIKPNGPVPAHGVVNVYDEAKPSRFTGTPEDIDAWLHGGFAEDRLLEFYQWIGRMAVSEALGDVRATVGEDPVPPEHRYYSQESVYEFLDAPEEGGPYPSKLPLGHAFCDVQWHEHQGGGDRLPTCRLDSPV